MLIVDAGPLYAAAATRDKHHKRCVELLSNSPGPLVVPALVVTEVAYLLADRIGPTPSWPSPAPSAPASSSSSPSSSATGPASRD